MKKNELIVPRKGHGTLTIHKPKLSFGGKSIPVASMSDPDRDGFPNAIDCNNLDRNKQGLGTWLKARGDQYKAWKAKAPERAKTRHEEKMQRLQYQKEESGEQLAIQKTRQATAQSRMSIQQQRQRMMAQRQKSMGQMPSMMSGFGGFSGAVGKEPSLMTGMPPGMMSATPLKRKKARKKRKNRGVKGSGKGKTITLRLG